MKRLIIFVSILLFLFSSSVFAQTSMDSMDIIRPFGIEDRGEPRQEVKDVVDLIRSNRKQITFSLNAKPISNIDQMLQNKNESWTTHANKVLVRLELILAKIETRTNLYAEDGEEISKVTQAISEAEVAIAKAQQAVDAQTNKDYTVDNYQEKNTGLSVKNKIEELKDDIGNIVAVVRDARTEVQQALRELQLLNKNEQ